MDDVKSPDLMGGKEYKDHTKNKGISLEMLLLLRVLLFHYSTELGNPGRLLNCLSHSMHSIRVRGLHITHPMTQHWLLHPKL